MVSLQQETKWALYQKVGADAQERPCDQRCAECFDLWQRGFKYLSWSSMVEKAEASELFRDAIAEARKAMTGAKPMQGGAGVSSSTKVSLSIDRRFLVMSEKEMKKKAGLSRIPRPSLRNLPSITTPTADGSSTETLCAFLDPHEDCRVATCQFKSPRIRWRAGWRLLRASGLASLRSTGHRRWLISSRSRS